jgi:hypothetical protein
MASSPESGRLWLAGKQAKFNASTGGVKDFEQQLLEDPPKSGKDAAIKGFQPVGC